MLCWSDGVFCVIHNFFGGVDSGSGLWYGCNIYCGNVDVLLDFFDKLVEL